MNEKSRRKLIIYFIIVILLSFDTFLNIYKNYVLFHLTENLNNKT
jgi:hypothetical protein